MKMRKMCQLSERSEYDMNYDFLSREKRIFSAARSKNHYHD